MEGERDEVSSFLFLPNNVVSDWDHRFEGGLKFIECTSDVEKLAEIPVMLDNDAIVSINRLSSGPALLAVAGLIRLLD